MNKKQFIFCCLYLCSYFFLACPMNSEKISPENIDDIVHAIINNKIKKTKNLLKKIKIINNIKLEFNDTLLHIAVDKNHYKIAKILIEKGINVNAKNNFGQTPIHCIQFNKNMLKMVKLLVKNRANIETSLHGQNLRPIHLAAENNNIEILNYLIKKDADIEAKYLDLLTPLAICTQFGHLNAAKSLIKNGAKITSAISFNNCPKLLQFIEKISRNKNFKIIKTKKETFGYFSKKTLLNNRQIFHFPRKTFKLKHDKIN